MPFTDTMYKTQKYQKQKKYYVSTIQNHRPRTLVPQTEQGTL